MNPQIHSRWGLLCPSCQKLLINPNQPWPIACNTCGQRTHVKCLDNAIHWLVDLDITANPNETKAICVKCRQHAANNLRIINQLPQASGSQPFDTYRAWKAKQPAAPKRDVVNLWGDYRVDPDNFVPAVTKVLDIVHNVGPKVRWAVKLENWDRTPVTNMSAKEIHLPNYFDSPDALGKTHQEILDAMTGAAMHEAGHAAYDSAETIIEAQKRIKRQPGQSVWANSTCLNIVCDYNLERKVIERYPAFKHYFTECQRWSINNTLPGIVKALQEDGAEDRLNVRLAVLTWELLGPGDLEHAGGVITPKLRWITQKCFSILKYAYTKGLLNTEPGKLKTGRALYELIRVVNPVGFNPPPIMTPVPQPPQPGQPQGPVIGGTPGQGGQQSDDPNAQPQPGTGTGTGQGGYPDMPRPDEYDDEGTPGSPGESEDEDTSDDVTDAQGNAPGSVPATPGDSGRTGEGGPNDPGDSEGDRELPEGSEEAPDSPAGTGSGDRDTDDDGTGTDSGSDGNDSSESDAGHDGAGQEDEASQEDGSSDVHEKDDEPGQADNTGPEDEDSGQSVGSGDSNKGGKSGSEQELDPANDPWTGKGDLEDDPTRRKNSKKDALDDLIEENQSRTNVKEDPYDTGFTNDSSFTPQARQTSEQLSSPPKIEHREPNEYDLPQFIQYHTQRVTNLAPVISRLKKVLRFRNADWGGKQTGRRAGTLTRRHVNRLSTLGSDKVFHKTQPDQTPKVRIALLVDESESMRMEMNGLPCYIAAKNAATALTQALHGIRGVKTWVWGFSMQARPRAGHVGNFHVPTMRLYAEPYHAVNPATLEAPPMMGGTPTGEAMDYAAETLYKSSDPNEKKVVFIITDGESGGTISTATSVRKWFGKVTFVHIGIGTTKDDAIPFYVGPVTDITLLPDLLSESVSEILH